MSNSSNRESILAIVDNVMKEAIKVMSQYPPDYIPPDIEIPVIKSRFNLLMNGLGIEELVSNQRIAEWLNGIKDTWPKEFLPVFVQSSSILAMILDGFGVAHSSPITKIDFERLELELALGIFDSKLKELKKENKDAEEIDPTGFKKAVIDELNRRRIARHCPFARTITTLLGQDALLWLTTSNQHGGKKLQPWEFSRTGWYDIWSIANQVAIEQELLNLQPEDNYAAKIVVALSWTLMGLASFIQSAVFLGENISHLVSNREGKYTVESGTSSHTLVSFHSASMIHVVRILKDGLRNPLLSAADLMWIGAGLAREREIRSGLNKSVQVVEEKFDLFLSHRGRDAKQVLSIALQSLHPTHGIFLDCLILPRGVINRNFVFGSLVKSKLILIVETENFNESDWCRKEAWLADAMAAHGLAKIQRITLPDALKKIDAEAPLSSRWRRKQKLRYPIAQRVLKDIDYWARAPNLFSLKKEGHPAGSLVLLEEALKNVPRPEDLAWIHSIGEIVGKTLSNVIITTPEAEPLDLWATALQFSVAAFCLTSNGRSKNEVRRGIDQLNEVLQSIVTARLHCNPIFLAQASGHLALLAAASAIQLTGFELDPRMIPALRIAIGDTAGLRDGLLLLDVREPGAKRSFRLHLIAVLIKGGLGSIGIVQNATDQVHQSRIDGLPLEVLPCVTLYPGMDNPFSDLSPH